MQRNPFKFFKKRKVLVHCPSGDLILEVQKDNIINVPWFVSWNTCPFHLEPDGRVTLRLMWDTIPASGYGKIWKDITWEDIKE